MLLKERMIIRADKALARLTGHNREELIGSPASVLHINVKDYERMTLDAQPVLRAGRPHHNSVKGGKWRAARGRPSGQMTSMVFSLSWVPPLPNPAPARKKGLVELPALPPHVGEGPGETGDTPTPAPTPPLLPHPSTTILGQSLSLRITSNSGYR